MKYDDGEYYHLYNRGAHKSNIFFSLENYRYFLRLLEGNSLRFNVSVLAYCLMSNHFHLLVRQNEGGAIDKLLKTTISAYTQAVNNQQGFSGVLFQGKTRSRHVDSDVYAAQVIRYIHLNPVDAGLVVKPDEWEFSNYLEWIEDQENSPNASYDKSERAFGKLPELRNTFFSDGAEYIKFVADYQRERDILKIEKYLYNE